MGAHHMQIHQDPLPLLWLIKPHHFLKERCHKFNSHTCKEKERGEKREKGEGSGEREGGRGTELLTLAAMILFVGMCLILKTSPVIPLPILPMFSISLSVNLYVYNYMDDDIT